MNTIDLEGLYAIYDLANNDVWRFSNEGEVQLFGHYMEAEERCDEHQMPIRCTGLSPAWQQIIIAQIESINQRTI